MIDNIIGNKVLVRIVRFLFLSPNRYFSFLDIEKYLGVGRESIHLALRKLDYYSMVYVEKKGGKRYKLRLDNPLVKHMWGLLEYEKQFLQGIDPKKLHVISNVENDCIKNVEGLKDMWLFGSVAKGKSTKKSDIDLLIVVQTNSVHVKTAVEEVMEKYENKFTVQTLIMDEAEFFKRRKEKLVKEILESGINLKLV